MLTHTLSRSPRFERRIREDSKDVATTSSQSSAQSQSRKVTSQSSASSNIASNKLHSTKDSIEVFGKPGTITSDTKDRHTFGGPSKMGKGESSSSDCKTVARLCAELATVGTPSDIQDELTKHSQKGMQFVLIL